LHTNARCVDGKEVQQASDALHTYCGFHTFVKCVTYLFEVRYIKMQGVLLAYSMFELVKSLDCGGYVGHYGWQCNSLRSAAGK